MLKWKAEYSVKISQLDNQHKEFFGILDELSEASSDGDELDIDYIMAKLDVYALYHFTCEEHYMEKYGYPDFEKHKKEHDEYKSKLEVLKSHRSEKRLKFAKEAQSFLEQWWINHIQKTDIEYSPFLADRVRHIPFN